MHERRIRQDFSNALTTFTQSAAVYFKTVRVWRPDTLYIHGALSDTLPIAGIEITGGSLRHDEPTSWSTYLVMVYVICEATSSFTDEHYEDMIFDLRIWLEGKIKARLQGDDIGTDGEEEIVTAVRLKEWRVEGREDVFRGALELLSEGYFGSWFRFEVTTQKTNAT